MKAQKLAARIAAGVAVVGTAVGVGVFLYLNNNPGEPAPTETAVTQPSEQDLTISEADKQAILPVLGEFEEAAGTYGVKREVISDKNKIAEYAAKPKRERNETVFVGEDKISLEAAKQKLAELSDAYVTVTVGNEVARTMLTESVVSTFDEPVFPEFATLSGERRVVTLTVPFKSDAVFLHGSTNTDQAYRSSAIVKDTLTISFVEAEAGVWKLYEAQSEQETLLTDNGYIVANGNLNHKNPDAVVETRYGAIDSNGEVPNEVVMDSAQLKEHLGSLNE